MSASEIRFLVFIGLGMLVMQAESGWAASAKFAYFPLVVAFLVAAIKNMGKLDSRVRRSFKPIFTGFAILFVFMVGQAFLSAFRGEDWMRVFRDFFTYFLLCAAPIIGVDASRTMSLTAGKRLVGIVTGLAAVSFAVFWLSARGVSLLPLDRLFMFSMVLTGLGILVGWVYGMLRFDIRWLVFSAFCLVSVLVTGTRSGFILVLGIFGSLGVLRHRRIPLPRFAVGVLAIVAGVYFSLPWLAAKVSREGFIDSRIKAVSQVFHGGLSSDNSGAIRARAVQITQEEWEARPIFGVGFGHAFKSPLPGQAAVDFQLDSNLLLLAKFGVVGVIVMLVAVGFILWGVIKFHVHSGARTEAQTIGTSLILMCCFLTVLGAPTEDKGLAYGVCLVAYLLASHALHAIHRSKPVVSDYQHKDEGVTSQQYLQSSSLLGAAHADALPKA